MAIHNLPDVTYLREHLDYDQDTGEFYWRKRPIERFRVLAGKPAGYVVGGYRRIGIGGIKFYAHRLAWLMAYGQPVPREIDHIDGNPSNNRLSNLRAASHANNIRNAKVRSDSQTGVKGVYPVRNKFVAEIRHNGRRRHIGLFETLEEASAARREAAKRVQGEFARHSVRESGNGD